MGHRIEFFKLPHGQQATLVGCARMNSEALWHLLQRGLHWSKDGQVVDEIMFHARMPQAIMLRSAQWQCVRGSFLSEPKDVLGYLNYMWGHVNNVFEGSGFELLAVQGVFTILACEAIPDCNVQWESPTTCIVNNAMVFTV